MEKNINGTTAKMVEEKNYNVYYDEGRYGYEGKGYYAKPVDSPETISDEEDYMFTAKVGDEWFDKVGYTDNDTTVYSHDRNVDVEKEDFEPFPLDEDTEGNIDYVTYSLFRCRLVGCSDGAYVDMDLVDMDKADEEDYANHTWYQQKREN